MGIFETIKRLKSETFLLTFKHFVEEDKIYLAIVKMHFKQKRVSINVALVADIFFCFALIFLVTQLSLPSSSSS